MTEIPTGNFACCPPGAALYNPADDRDGCIASSDERILRIEEADTTPDVNRRNQAVLSKPCAVPGCTGTMHFHERLTVADAPHTLERPWHASWRCTQDSAHFQLLSRAEEREIIRRRDVT